MTKHRSHSIEFKRQVAQEFIAGETLHGLPGRYDLSRNLIRIWVAKYETGALDEDAGAGFSGDHQVRVATSAADTDVGVNIDGNATAEMWIKLDGAHALVANDFLL